MDNRKENLLAHPMRKTKSLAYLRKIKPPQKS